jgi:hypothetical protein
MSTTGAKLPKSWPPGVRDAVLDAARYYYRQMNEPFAVPDVEMDRAVAWASREIDDHRGEIYEDASDRWIHRWESGAFEADIRKTIEQIYGRLRRAERPFRGHATASKKTGRQLDAEIANALRRR